jgi:hypothetical protein
VLVALAVQENGRRDPVLLEEVEEAPRADPVAVFAPRPVVGVRMREPGRVREPEPADAVREVLDAERDVDGEPLAVRPREVGTLRDRRVREPAVIR